MYEEHEMLKRAAVQLINNMVFSEEVVKMFEGKNDRVKYFVLLCATTDDLQLVQAAIGTLAVVTAMSKRASKKVFEVILIPSITIYFFSLRRLFIPLDLSYILTF